MFFTADDRHRPGGRSRLWSAVSLDQVNWQIEGEVLGAEGVEYFYSALVGDRLYTLQTSQMTDIGTRTLVAVTLVMP